MTPAEIAGEIIAALQGVAGEPQRLLSEALDSLSDGMPADHVATILRLALDKLDRSP